MINTKLIRALVGVTLLGVAGLASAQITGTKHNLGSMGTGTNKFSGTAEICVFCHTPHGSDTSAPVPLWNRSLPASNTYTTYDALGTSTLEGKTAAVGSVSIACLSCHDGAQAMNNVINASGSGLAGSAAWTGGTWAGANQVGGKIAGVANLGTDLRNDHPIGIQYGGGNLTSAAPSGTTRDKDFAAPATAVIGSQQAWWVNTTATGSTNNREKTDMILYSRPVTNFGGSGTDVEPSVECASCHDPHTANQTFLRVVNDNSAVCLACHTK